MEDQAQHGFVQSLARGLAVIRAFNGDRTKMSLTEVAAATGLTRATARRFLLTLESLGYVRYRDRWYSLAPRVLELGFPYLSTSRFPSIALPHLELLSETVRESVSASVLDTTEIVHVAGVTVPRIMGVAIGIGSRYPAHATAMGKVLLAWLAQDELDTYMRGFDRKKYTARTITDPGQLKLELQQIAEQGWCLVDQELEDALRAVAAPVRQGSTVVGAISVFSTAGRESLEDTISRVVEPLLKTAADISEDLTYLQLASLDQK
jgi:IclR family pca regulon transcriptional regulator